MERSAPAVRRTLLIFSNLIAAVLGVMLAGWGGEMMIDAWSYSTPGAPLPRE